MAVTERYILSLKWFGVGCGGPGPGVLANPEEVVECHVGQICGGFSLVTWALGLGEVPVLVQQVFQERHRYCQLWGRPGVIPAVAS